MKVSEYLKSHNLKELPSDYPVPVFAAGGRTGTFVPYSEVQAATVGLGEPVSYEKYREKIETEKKVAGGKYAITVLAQQGKIKPIDEFGGQYMLTEKGATKETVSILQAGGADVSGLKEDKLNYNFLLYVGLAIGAFWLLTKKRKK